MSEHKCARCGWRYPGFHICVDLSYKAEGEGKLTSHRGPTAAARAKAAETMSQRWADYRESNRERDNKIIERYKAGGVGYKDIAAEFGISKTTVQKIMQEAARDGRVQPRPRSHTISRPGTQSV